MTDLIAEISTLVKSEDWETIRQNSQGQRHAYIPSHHRYWRTARILPLLRHGLEINLIF